GRMPAPIIMPISMSLRLATPSSRTRQASANAFREKRSTTLPAAFRDACAVACSISLTPVVVEALAGLLSEVPRRHQLLHLGRDVEPIAVGLLQVLGDVQDGVEPEQVAQVEGPHRRHLRVRDLLVDLLCGASGLVLVAPDLAGRRVENPVDHEARHLDTPNRVLADLLSEVDGRL